MRGAADAPGRVAIRARALAIAAAVLLVAEIGFRVVAPVSVPPDFRLPDRTLWAIDEFVDSAAKTPGVRIAVVGDSVVWGGFADRDQTLSARMDADYASAGRSVHAFNFGLNGAHANDLGPLVEVLADRKAADLVVVNFDYRFYGESPVADRYPRLRTMVAGDGGPASTAAGLSSIAARREYLLAVTVGDKPSTAFSRTVETAIPRLLGRPLWRKRNAEQLDLGALRSDFGVPPLTADSTYVRYLLASVRAARERRVRVVVFAGPLDRGLLSANDLYDPALYAANLGIVRRLVEQEGGEFLDLTDSVPATEIRDSHHPMPEGYARLARVLEQRIELMVRDLEQERLTGTGAP